jgi:ubiquinone/menaquinone biosynthesis C-methylase UbiE
MDDSKIQSLREEFNRWAESGRGDGMEQDHLPITVPVIEKMRIGPTENVLEVGCGSGWLSRRISKLAPDGRVVGMDVSDEMIRVARRTSLDHHNVQFITGEVASIPQEASLFTHAISVESAYYWPEPAAGAREIHRVLRPGGAAWILINYYRDNAFCHQWEPYLPFRLICSPRKNGRNFSAQRVSRRYLTSGSSTPHRHRRFTPGGGSAMRRNSAR